MPRSSLVRPYMKFSGADEPPVEYLDTVWDDLRVPVSATKQNPVTSKPDFDVWRGSIRTYLFDGATDEEVHFAAQLPHKAKLGSNLHAHVHWSPMTTGTGTVIWYLEYTWAVLDDDFPGTATLGPITYTIPSDEQYKHILTDMGNIDFSSNDNVSSMISCRLYRDANVDTYAGEVAFHEFDFHYEIDTAGSRTEMTK